MTDGRRLSTAAALGIALLVAACGPGGELVWPTPQLELHYSGEQELIVRNDLAQQLALVTADGSSSTALPPGEALTLRFSVLTISELEDSPRGSWYMAREVGQFDLAQEAGELRYLRTRGPNLELLLRTGDTVKTGLLTLQGCARPWGEQPAAAASRTVTVTQLTRIAGVPVRHCPMAQP